MWAARARAPPALLDAPCRSWTDDTPFTFCAVITAVLALDSVETNPLSCTIPFEGLDVDLADLSVGPGGSAAFDLRG